jgi:hypothetical protein
MIPFPAPPMQGSKGNASSFAHIRLTYAKLGSACLKGFSNILKFIHKFDTLIFYIKYV